MYKLILATRYLFKRPISWLAIVSIAICVFIVVVVMTVMNGLVEDFRRKNHEFAGDCVVHTDSLVGFAYYDEFAERLERVDFVEAVSPVVNGYALLSQKNADRHIGIEVMGVDPVRHSRVTNFAETLYYHRETPETAFVPEYDPQQPGCVLGIDKMPNTRQRDGEYWHSPQPPRYELLIISFPLTAKGGLAQAGLGADVTNRMTFFYSDDSHSGLVKVDGNVVYVSLENAQKLMGMTGPEPRASAIHIRFADSVGLQECSGQVRRMWKEFVEEKAGARYAHLLENVRVESWREFRKETIAPMEKEQTMLILLFALLGLITVFVVFVVFYMIVAHKSKDIGILKSVGVSEWGVAQFFFLFATLIGILGSALGAVVGAAFVSRINVIEDWLFAKYGWQLWDRSIYAIGEIPHDVRASVLAVILLCAVVVSLLGALVPSIRIARQRCVEVLQVNRL